MDAKKAQWVRAAVDYGAPIAFALTFYPTKDFMLATEVLVVASVLALAVGFLVEKRVALLPLFAGVIAIVFGAAALIFHNESFVKIKLTVINAALAAVMLGGLVLRKNPMKVLFGESLRLAEDAWRVLMLRYGLYFLTVAVVNEAVWRTQTDSTWVTFRMILLPLAIVFSLTQVPFMMKHMQKDGDENATPEPPDPGF
ncbi:septation protein IspZ [Caulobacter sp. 17J65-9]|uniref:inner membrane-spanning protein YciB n=1 Tax=Caulobacter sp. 17J65-9 TaxID=2709382 RepID=UPI003204891D